jgi:hypothetical protein
VPQSRGGGAESRGLLEKSRTPARGGALLPLPRPWSKPNLSKQWFVKGQTPGRKSHRSGGNRQDPHHSGNSGTKPITNGCTTSGLVHLPPDLVGPSHPGLDLRAAARAYGGHAKMPPKVHPLRRQGPEQETDVLDTWFSSALWPFSTMGWPEKTDLLKTLLSHLGAGHRVRHPVLLGGPHDDDGHPLHGEVPFKDVYTSTPWCGTKTARK